MKNEIAITRALEMLKKSGKKQTKNREEMIRYLALENRYLSAKEVYSFLVQDNPGVSFYTNYRNLKDFSEIGILEETELNAEKNFSFHCILLRYYIIATKVKKKCLLLGISLTINDSTSVQLH